MSNYDFLKMLDKRIIYLHSPVYYGDDGSFSVDVDDAEGWNTTTVFFNADGSVKEETYDC